MESQFNSCLLGSLPLPRLSLCCGRGWVQALGGCLPLLPSCLREKCRRTEGWRRDRAGLGSRGCGDAPREREAAGSASGAARAILKSHPAGGNRARVSWPKRCPPCGDPPCALRLHPEPGHWLTWDNLSLSGEAALGSWHSFPNLPDPLINVSFFKSHWKVCLENFESFP